MAKIKRCCICGKIIVGDGNDPRPLIETYNLDKDDICCDYCYATKVIPFAVRTAEPNRVFSINAGIEETPEGKLLLTDISLLEVVDDD